jgi:hypothetical protein
VLSRLAAAWTIAMVMVACASSPPSATGQPPPARITARWVADDRTVVAVNLVVSAGMDAPERRALAERQRADHPGARVIVRIFAETAGPERYVIGHVPAVTEPLLGASPGATLLGVYDFPR